MQAEKVVAEITNANPRKENRGDHNILSTTLNMVAIITKDAVGSLVPDLEGLLWGPTNEPRNQVLKISLREKLWGYRLIIHDTQQQEMWSRWEPVQFDECWVKVREILPMSAGRARVTLQVGTYPSIEHAGILDGLCKETATISLSAVSEWEQEEVA